MLGSTADDEVFVYFTDHGGTGLIAMPVGDYVYYDELNATLTTMHDKGLYSKLVFYLEACEAGSMFDGVLSPALGIAVTTASNADESSWGTYCGTDAMVDGVDVGSCLGDLYSVSWMEDSDDLDQVCGEGLLAQFLRVKVETNLSHVTPFGDTSRARHALRVPGGRLRRDVRRRARATRARRALARSAAGDGRLARRDAPLPHAAYLLRGGSADAVAAEVRARDQADATNAAIVAALAGGEGVADTGRAHDARVPARRRHGRRGALRPLLGLRAQARAHAQQPLQRGLLGRADRRGRRGRVRVSFAHERGRFLAGGFVRSDGDAHAPPW